VQAWQQLLTHRLLLPDDLRAHADPCYVSSRDRSTRTRPRHAWLMRSARVLLHGLERMLLCRRLPSWRPGRRFGGPVRGSCCTLPLTTPGGHSGQHCKGIPALRSRSRPSDLLCQAADHPAGPRWGIRLTSMSSLVP
jgi:hypothetical protein